MADAVPTKHFIRTALTGGTTGCMDSIDGASLEEGYTCEVTLSTFVSYRYRLNATSGAAESSPDTISPDTNAGNKRWILVASFNQKTTTDASPTFVTAKLSGLTDGYVPVHTSDAAGLENSTLKSTSGAVTNASQPAFLAIAADQNDVTGDGTFYTVTFSSSERFDQSTNFDGTNFTAPVTGKYLFTTAVQFSGVTSSHTRIAFYIITSNKTYLMQDFNPYPVLNASGLFSAFGSIVADMDSADTASVGVYVFNGALVVDIKTTNSFFSGALIC